jgi:hypothetical protein
MSDTRDNGEMNVLLREFGFATIVADKLNHRVQIFDKKWILAQSNKNLIWTRSDLKI